MFVSGRRLLLLFLTCASAQAQQAFQVSGYIQGRFTNQGSTVDRLEIRRARIAISGDPLANFAYTVQVDIAKTPYLMDASITWKPRREFTLTGGQFKIPFSAESIGADRLNPPISRARAVLALAPGRDTGVQGRDVGVQVSGSLHQGNGPIVEYVAGVFRGQTLIYSPALHYRATAARLLYHPVHGLTVGGDWYGSFSAPARLEKRRQELEGSYTRGPLLLRAEQIWARDGKLIRRGGYGMGAWRFSPHWEGILRADWYTSNARRANTTSISYEAGANYYWSKYLKVGINTGVQHDQGPVGFTSIFLAQTQISF